jgi:hypothetical protein
MMRNGVQLTKKMNEYVLHANFLIDNKRKSLWSMI